MPPTRAKRLQRTQPRIPGEPTLDPFGPLIETKWCTVRLAKDSLTKRWRVVCLTIIYVLRHVPL